MKLYPSGWSTPAFWACGTWYQSCAASTTSRTARDPGITWGSAAPIKCLQGGQTGRLPTSSMMRDHSPRRCGSLGLLLGLWLVLGSLSGTCPSCQVSHISFPHFVTRLGSSNGGAYQCHEPTIQPTSPPFFHGLQPRQYFLVITHWHLTYALHLVTWLIVFRYIL